MININQLNFHYKKKHPLFDGLSLELESGKIYGLLGKNGTGKSTLLKLIFGSLFPKSGEITIGDVSSRLRRPSVLQEIFFLQEEYELPNIKVLDFVKTYGRFYPKFDLNQFKQNAESFEVDTNRSIKAFSYGQKKKILISFGLSCNTKYLILDEPTNGLDIPSKSQFRKIIAKNITEDQTVVISTHQIRDLGKLLDSVVIIDQGRIIFDKGIAEIESRLLFNTDHAPADQEGLIHSEMIPGGYMNILHNSDNQSSEVELESLFNAVIQNPNIINKSFENA